MHESGLPAGDENLFLKQARTVYWKKWAAKHQCEELKEGVWPEPLQASDTSKNDQRSERRMGAEKMIRHWSVGRRNWRGCIKEEGTAKHRLNHCPSRRKVRNQIPEGWETWEQRAQTKIGNGNEESRRTHHESKCHLSVRRWEWDTYQAGEWQLNVWEAMKLQMEWCAAASTYRCMTCGRGSKKKKKPGTVSPRTRRILSSCEKVTTCGWRAP